MNDWPRRCTVAALTFAVLSVAELSSSTVGLADDGCGDGMYYDYYTLNCQPWVQVNVNIDPYIPVPIPNFHPVPVKIPNIPGPPVVKPGRPKPGKGGRH